MIAAVTRIAGHVTLSLWHDRRRGEDDVDVVLRKECGVDVFEHPDHVSGNELLRASVEMPLIGVTALVLVAKHVTEIALHTKRGSKRWHHHERVGIRRQVHHVHVLLRSASWRQRRCRSCTAAAAGVTWRWASSARAGRAGW